ncbi:MAG: hypothetical protein E6G05_03085 [Actinobacteria bacterium]|nr:MAG: hypothetical protein E6G05_03085 [Actinomycetota bacterium]
MFHVEMRRFPHVGRAFNLDRDELLARFVMPWIRGAEISLDERHWAHDVKTRLTVYDGPPIAPEERGLGRGWSAVTREGRNVTEELLDEASNVITPAVPLPELKAALLAAAQAGPLRPSEAVILAGRPGRASERLALTEQAVWELLHEGQLLLADADGRVGSERWESLVLAWDTWADRDSGVVLRAAPRRAQD